MDSVAIAHPLPFRYVGHAHNKTITGKAAEMTYELEDHESKPTGRARGTDVPGWLMDALHHSASTGKGKVVKTNGVPEVTGEQVKELRGFLRNRKLRALFTISTEVKAVGNEMFRFKFGAEHAAPQADEPPAAGEAPAAAPPAEHVAPPRKPGK